MEAASFLLITPANARLWRLRYKARGIPLPSSDQILLDCAIRRDGKAVERPAVIVGDGKTGTIETTERCGSHRYRIELTPSTSPAMIAVARRQQGV